MNSSSSSEEREIVIVLRFKHIILIVSTIIFVICLWFLIRSFFSPSFHIEEGVSKVYKPGDLVELKGKLVAGLSPVSNVPVIVEIRDPNGLIVWIDQLVTQADGSFIIKFRLRPDASKGVYKVYVSCSVAKTNFEFKVE